MSPRYPRLRLFYEGGKRAAVSDALVMCFYMQCTHKRIAPAIMRALDLLRERIHPHRFEWRIKHDGYYAPLDWEAAREEMLGSGEVVVLRMRDEVMGMGSFYVEYRGLRIPSPWSGREKDASSLYLRLPTEFLEEQGPARVRALACELAEEIPFNSGYVDLALCHMHTLGTGGFIQETQERYLGLHIDDGLQVSINTWVEGVHWMNFLGQPVLGKLGGVAGLRERLAHPDISLQEMTGERVLLTLGDAPRLGDVQAGEQLPLHRMLAKVLEPHLFFRYASRGHPTPEKHLRWERRFLD
jgi:hypothetical protein